MIKVAAPNMACQVIDWAIQAHGGVVSPMTLVSGMLSNCASTPFPDGPDEVHRNQIARWS
ncbi:MAG: hypothetical protein CM1200mP18_21080 [Gammaproteobacteria bacterium]|nr:MAG: hypothetical protein CM1200mP18_21080 [Gammaproteobacteria bacterium]